MLANRIPALDKKGDQVLAFRRVVYLAKIGYAIKVICFASMRSAEDIRARDVLESYGVSVLFVRWNMWEASLNLLIAIMLTKTPFQCALYKSAEFSDRVTREIQQFKPDIVYCILVRVAENLKYFNGKYFVEIVDSMGLNFSRRALSSRFIKRWIFSIEACRISAYEKYLADKSERSFVVSAIDQKSIGSDKVDVIPLGIDVHKLEQSSLPKQHPTLIFTGNMNYQPNVDAVCWFVLRCWESIKQAVPQIHLVIAGNNPQARILSIGDSDDSIRVTGHVTSMSNIINSATIAIAPMQSGSGMQFKVLEAMACGIPVVTTSLGLGDIRAKIGQELLVADSEADFIKCVLDLLSSQELQVEVGRAGYNFVKNNHAWDTLNARFESRIARALEA